MSCGTRTRVFDYNVDDFTWLTRIIISNTFSSREEPWVLHSLSRDVSPSFDDLSAQDQKFIDIIHKNYKLWTFKLLHLVDQNFELNLKLDTIQTSCFWALDWVTFLICRMFRLQFWSGHSDEEASFRPLPPRTRQPKRKNIYHDWYLPTHPPREVHEDGEGFSQA